MHYWKDKITKHLTGFMYFFGKSIKEIRCVFVVNIVQVAFTQSRIRKLLDLIEIELKY